jgi:hypothetical protein
MAIAIDQHIREHYAEDFAQYEEWCRHWHENDRFWDIALFLTTLLSTTLTLVAGVLLDGSHLKIAVAILGAISAISAGLQKYLRTPKRAAFYARATNDMHALGNRLPLVSTVQELEDLLSGQKHSAKRNRHWTPRSIPAQ